MKKLILFFASIVGLALIAGCAKDEKNLNGTISGLVTDYTNANTPIAGATVTLNIKGLTKTTGNDGRFEFVNIEPGTYTLQITANNYQATTKQVTVYAGQIANCDVQLAKGAASVDISPVTLTFGKDVEQLSFTISNNGNQSLTFSISNAPDFIEVTPASGAVAAKSKQAVSVHVINRSSITTNRTGQLTVNVGNDSYIVSIAVTNSTNTDPGGGGDQGGGGDTGDIILTRGLLAYYSFDDGQTATNVYDNAVYNGQLHEKPEFVTNGNGYALRFRTGQYVSIPDNMLSGKKAYSVSMWVKDFGQGYLFRTYDDQIHSPSFLIDANDFVEFQTGESTYYSTCTFSNNMASYQSGSWHMITLVKNASDNALFYIDGINVDTQLCSSQSSTGNVMSIGSPTTAPMYVDNVRIHGIALSSDEVSQIYNAEK